MSERYKVDLLDELAAQAIPGQAQWHTIRSELGIAAFGINAWTATEDDQQIIGEHDEADGEGHEELYIVLSGHAAFMLDGETVDAPQGTLVHVPDPSVKRGATGMLGTTILVVGAKPGEVFTPSPWERSAEALRYWPTEDWTRPSRSSRPISPTPGQRGHALQPRVRAGARRPSRRGTRSSRTRGRAAAELRRDIRPDDDDLASIRDDPRFPAG